MPEEAFIHPTAIVEAEIGAGTRVWAYAHVMEGAVVGSGCKIGDHAFIESGARLGDRVTVKNGCLIWHGVTLADEVFVGPAVVFTNDVTPRVRHQTGPEDWQRTVVQSGASIGANATILSGLTIGKNALVGAGSVVTKDVDSHSLVVGNPARHVGWVCQCGSNLDEDQVCQICGNEYQVTDTGLRTKDG